MFLTGAYLGGALAPGLPLEGKNIVLIFNVKNMLKFENFEIVHLKCTPFRFINTPLLSNKTCKSR